MHAFADRKKRPLVKQFLWLFIFILELICQQRKFFLYTDFILPFQTAGLILFTAMIASISLTFRLRAGVKRQKPGNQLQKNKENSLFFAQNTGKSGLENLNYDD